MAETRRTRGHMNPQQPPAVAVIMVGARTTVCSGGQPVRCLAFCNLSHPSHLTGFFVMRLLLTLVVAFSISSIANAAPPEFSGPQVGEAMPPFRVVGVYDENAGEEAEVIKLIDGKPVLLVFVHKLTRPGIALTRSLTLYADSLGKEKAVTRIIWLTDDKAKAEQYLTNARRSLNFKVPVGISVDGIEGPGAYGLNRNVELTILVGKENKVTANFAIVQPSLSEAAKIAGELSRAAGVDPPTAEQLNKLAHPGGNPQQRMRQMKKKDADAKATPTRGAASDASQNTALRDLMKAMLADQNSETATTKSVAAINAWVGDNKDRRAARARMARAVLARGLGNDVVRKTLETWQAEIQQDSAAEPSDAKTDKPNGRRKKTNAPKDAPTER